jgi:hypothetical protein
MNEKQLRNDLLMGWPVDPEDQIIAAAMRADLREQIDKVRREGMRHSQRSTMFAIVLLAAGCISFVSVALTFISETK